MTRPGGGCWPEPYCLTMGALRSTPSRPVACSSARAALSSSRSRPARSSPAENSRFVTCWRLSRSSPTARIELASIQLIRGNCVTTLRLDSEESALEYFLRAASGEMDNLSIDLIEIGDWVNPTVHIPAGDSDITAPFMQAFIATQDALYRVVAELKYGSPDVRRLTEDDKLDFRIRVRVTEGSSNLLGGIAEAIERIGTTAVDKLSARQVVTLIAGSALLFGGGAIFSDYLEHRKEVRVAELQSEERIKAIEALQFANEQQALTARAVVDAMKGEGGVHETAVKASEDANDALLKAASTEPQTVINGHHLTAAEARELRGSSRRRTTSQYVTRQLRVTRIDTTDLADTKVIVEEMDSEESYSLTFADRLIQDRDIGKLYVSLRNRTPIWLKLELHQVGDETRSAEIRGVARAPRRKA